MAHGIRYPQGWPNRKRIQDAAKNAKSNLRATAYRINQDKESKGLVETTYLSPNTEMSTYG